MNIITSLLSQVKDIKKLANHSTTDFLTNNTSNNVVVINDFLQFDSTKPYWNHLLNTLSNQNTFLSHDWMNTNWIWNEVIGSPNIILVYKDEELVAIFPLSIEYISNKTVFKFLSNPLIPYNDALINPEYTEFAINTLFDLLHTWKAHWDIVELSNLPLNSVLLNKLSNTKREDVPFKYKIKTMNPISYIRMYDPYEIDNWEIWLENQPPASKKIFLRLRNMYNWLYDTNATYEFNIEKKLTSDKLDIQKDTTFDQTQLVNILFKIVENGTKKVKIYKLNRLRSINSFIKRFNYYNKNNKWIINLNWLKNRMRMATQYAFIHNNNYYYLAMDIPSSIAQYITEEERFFLEALVLQSCFSSKINKFYLNDISSLGQKRLQKNWRIDKENRFQIIIYNKTKKWF